MRTLNARGETLVEVLMVVMILGSALTSAFVITNRSTAVNRLSLERAEANGYAQTQLERIKSKLSKAAQSDINTMNSTSVAFCIDDTDVVLEVTDLANSGCKSKDRYQTYTKYDGSTMAYTTRVLWEGPTGDKNAISLVYRAYVSYFVPVMKGTYVA